RISQRIPSRSAREAQAERQFIIKGEDLLLVCKLLHNSLQRVIEVVVGNWARSGQAEVCLAIFSQSLYRDDQPFPVLRLPLLELDFSRRGNWLRCDRYAQLLFLLSADHFG